MKSQFMKRNKSFARRIGKSLSNTQKKSISDILPKYLIDLKNPLEKLGSNNEIIFEIGFGMGEHLAHQVKVRPENFYIGAEPYLNGVANFLKLVENYQNYALYSDDSRDLLDKLPDNYLAQIYILFPDPWPKRVNHKKRLINEELHKIILNKLKIGGKLNIVTDDELYAKVIKNIFTEDFKNLNIYDEDLFIPHENYIETKYHQKALNKQIFFFKYQKIN